MTEPVKLITVSENPDMAHLFATATRFARLMHQVVNAPGAYRGMSLDIILSMLAYSLQVTPDRLGPELRRLCDAIDKGEYREDSVASAVRGKH